jgi:hypothetical protein
VALVSATSAGPAGLQLRSIDPARMKVRFRVGFKIVVSWKDG